MIAVEATLARLQTARDLLLTPYGLDESTLLNALRVITQHRVDDADLYFQYTRSEGWSLEEGIVIDPVFGDDLEGLEQGGFIQTEGGKQQLAGGLETGDGGVDGDHGPIVGTGRKGPHPT